MNNSLFYIDRDQFIYNLRQNLAVSDFFFDRMEGEMLSEEGMTDFELIEHMVDDVDFLTVIGHAIRSAAGNVRVDSLCRFPHNYVFSEVKPMGPMFWCDRIHADYWGNYIKSCFPFLDVFVKKNYDDMFELCVLFV